MLYRNFGLYRFVLAFLVMLQHFGLDAAPESVARLLRPLDPGGIAVFAFFALSGFVICEAAERLYQGRPVAFIGNRLLRIVPHFVVAALLAITVLFVLLQAGRLRLEHIAVMPGAGSFAPVNIAANLAAFLPLADRFMSVDFVEYGWAVRVEMAFYCVVALCLAAALAMRHWRPISFGGTLAMAGVPICALFFAAHRHHAPLLFTYAPYFIFGAALYYISEHNRAAWAALTLSLPGMAWSFLVRDSHDPVLLAARQIGLQFILLTLVLGVLVLLASFRWRPMPGDRSFGNLTYPLYLYHKTVMYVVIGVTDGYSLGAFGAGMAASLLVATLAAAAIDPTMSHLRDRIRGRRLTPVAPRPALLAATLQPLQGNR